MSAIPPANASTVTGTTTPHRQILPCQNIASTTAVIPEAAQRLSGTYSKVIAAETGMTMCGGTRNLTDDVGVVEELADLDGRVLGTVGAVHGVAGEAFGEQLADGAGGGVGGVGGAHHLAVAGD